MTDWREPLEGLVRLAGRGGPVVAAVCLVLATAGCGDDGSAGGDRGVEPRDGAAVRASFADFESAFQAGDGERACARLTEEATAQLVASLSSDDGESCDRVVRRVAKASEGIEQQPSKILSVDVDGDRAIASVSDAGRDPVDVPFVRRGGRWLLADLDLAGG